MTGFEKKQEQRERVKNYIKDLDLDSKLVHINLIDTPRFTGVENGWNTWKKGIQTIIITVDSYEEEG